MTSSLVSILIPAYNAEKWLAYTLRSALAQTWANKEIIIVDDGSTDCTLEIAEEFAEKFREHAITVLRTQNRGQSAAMNTAFAWSHGDFIQWLDADDLLAPNKIEKQMAAASGPGVMLSSQWAPFFYRTRGAKFVHNSLCENLTPVEWMLRNLRDNVYMVPATWLVSRELTEAAGPWDETLKYNQDGEYFSRVLLNSEGTRFVPDTGAYYRASGTGSVSYIGRSRAKKTAMLRSMKLHIQYLRSLEDSERVRRACVKYIQDWIIFFYPECLDLSAELIALATSLGGDLERPRLRQKYAWMEQIIGFEAAKRLQDVLPQMKAAAIRQFDKTMFQLGGTNGST